MKTIPLTKGQVAIVDDEDFEWLSQWNWQAHWGETSHSFYAARNAPKYNGIRGTLFMHRQVLGIYPDDKRRVDHVEPEQTLDNRRSNLRIANNSQNLCNRRKIVTNKSGFKGVSFHRQTGKWQAEIKAMGVRKWLGVHTTPEAAHAAYCKAAKELHGDFARTE